MIREYMLNPNKARETIMSLIAKGNYKEAKQYFINTITLSMYNNTMDSSFKELYKQIKKGLTDG